MGETAGRGEAGVAGPGLVDLPGRELMLAKADFTDEELDGEVRHRQNRKRITVEDQRRAGLHWKILGGNQ